MAWPPYVDDDGTGTTGTIIDKAFLDAMKGYIDQVSGGPWDAITPTGSATSGTFTLTGMKAQANSAYGSRRTFVDLSFQGAISATPITLYVSLPAPLPLCARDVGGAYHYWGPGVTGTGLYQVLVGAGRVELLRDAAATAWPTAGVVYFYLQLSYPW